MYSIVVDSKAAWTTARPTGPSSNAKTCTRPQGSKRSTLTLARTPSATGDSGVARATQACLIPEFLNYVYLKGECVYNYVNYRL